MENYDGNWVLNALLNYQFLPFQNTGIIGQNNKIETFGQVTDR